VSFISTKGGGVARVGCSLRDAGESWPLADEETHEDLRISLTRSTTGNDDGEEGADAVRWRTEIYREIAANIAPLFVAVDAVADERLILLVGPQKIPKAMIRLLAEPPTT
jgi:hypothetical protein